MPKHFPLAIAAAAAALALTACGAGGGEAQPSGDTQPDYPTKSIEFVVPYPAGSGPDAGARVIAQELETELGQSVVVENVEGGSSTIGLYQLATSKPDGYTIGLGSFSGIAIQSRIIDNPFEGLASLTPIAQSKDPAFLLFAAPGKGWDSIDAFIDDAKAQPGKLTVAIPNKGSIPDILVSLLEEEADIELEHVYFDAGQQVLPVVNGTADVGIAQAGPVVQFVDTDQLEFVGAFGEAPEGIEVASFDDEGYDTSAIKDFEGIFGPAGLSDDIVSILSDAVEKAVASDAYTKLMKDTYNGAVFVPAGEFAAKAEEQDDTVVDIIDRLGLGK